MTNTRKYNEVDTKPYTLIINGQLVGFFASGEAALKDLRSRSHGPANWKIYYEDMFGDIRTVDEGDSI